MPPDRFVNFSAEELSSEAGGDPWELNDELQAGQPGAINDLADAFHNAAGCVAEVEDDFQRAKQQFEQGWTHDSGPNPINDAAEVTRATTQLGLQRTQTAVIAADLEAVAASLASAQRSSDADIAALNASLHAIDDQISAATAAGQDSQSLHQSAVAAVTAELGTIRGIQATYVESMKAAEAAMLESTGYFPDAIDNLLGQQDAASRAAQRYDETQRAADEATVRSAGPNSPEGKAAAARLRDYAAVTSPTTSAEAHRLAGERLDDYNMSKQVGPFQKDPITGSDPISRAKDRLYMQQVAERSGMTPDRATAMMDQAEARARTEYPRELVKKLEASGVSEQGAEKLVSDLEQGKGVPDELVRIGQATGGAGEGLEARADSLPTARHWGDLGYSASDAEALAKVGKYLGRGSSVAEVLFGVYEWQRGEPLDEVAVKTGSSIWGGMLAGGRLGAIGGEFVGPEGALVLGAIGAVGGGIVASDAASSFYSWLKE